MKNLIGKTINQYQILLKIRETGTRILFKAYDNRTKRNLALEVVKVEGFDSAELYALLHAQARRNAGLAQSNIAVMLDSGIFEDIPYFVYNFAPFHPLWRLFNQNFPWRDSARDLVAITQALTYAHEKGIFHGDLNPANIILDENKNPYLFDFGFEQIIQKYIISHLPGAWINNSGFAYSSPEQLIGEAVDARSDIYAMGLILQEWMTGKIAFLEETALATLYKRIYPPEKELDLKKVELPEIQAIIQRCIATEPRKRYQSMQELSVLLVRGALDVKITPKMAAKPLEVQPPPPPNPRARRRILILGLIVALLALVYAYRGNSLLQTFTRPTVTISASNIPTARATSRPQTFASPTATQTALPPTPTGIISTPTATLKTNTIDYPVLEGTALPTSLAKISPENSVRLVTLSRRGIGELNCLATSPDGSLFAAASPVGVFIYKSEGLVLQKYLDTSSWVSVVAFSPDGKQLAVGDRDGLITLWDTNSWSETGRHSGHKAGILGLAFSPDGTDLVSVAADDKLMKWGSSEDVISASVKDVANLVYSADGAKIVTGGNDFKINVWEPKKLELLKTITYSAKVVDIKMLKDSNTLVVGGSDRSVAFIDIETTEKSRPLPGVQNNLSRLAVAPDESEIIASDVYGGLVAWNKSGDKLWSVPKANGFTPSDNALGVNHSLAFSPDGKTVISGLRDGTIRLYEALTGKEIKQDNSLNSSAQEIAISHDSNFMLSQSGNGVVKMWDLRNGRYLFQVAGVLKQGSVFSLDDKHFAVAVNATTVKVFKSADGEEVYTFKGSQAIQVVQFVQNDRFLAEGTDPQIQLWAMASGQEVKTGTTFDGSGCTVISDLKGVALFSVTKYNYIPTGNGLSSLFYFCSFQKVAWMKAFSINDANSIIAYGGSSKLGFTSSGGVINDMSGVSFLNVEKVAINTENTLLAAAFDDYTISIWDTNTKQRIIQLYGHDNSITDLQFTPDGTLLLSASLDGTVRVWGIP